MQSIGNLGRDIDTRVKLCCDAFVRSTNFATDVVLLELLANSLVEGLFEGSVVERLGGSNREFLADGTRVGGVVVVEDEVPRDGTVI